MLRKQNIWQTLLNAISTYPLILAEQTIIRLISDLKALALDVGFIAKSGHDSAPSRF
jgi:hypothetical protein